MVGSRERYEICMEAAGIALAAGDRADAERALRGGIQAIEGLSDFRVELSATLVRLGSLKQEMGSYGEAEDLFRKALDVGERVLGSHDVGLVPALTGIGASRIMQGSPEQAHPFLARALDLSERHLGDGHPDLVILLNDLSRLYLRQSAHEYAEPLLLRLLPLKRAKGEDHPEVATVLASLASVRQALGRHDSAEQLWRRVLEIRERTLPPNHFSLATTLEHLASTLAARGKSREALQLYQRAFSIRELTLGTDHASLRASRERIADLQLQASEDSLDTDGPVTAPAPPLRLKSGERFGIPLSATLVSEMPSGSVSPKDPPWSFEREAVSSAEAAAPAAMDAAPDAGSPFEPLIPPPAPPPSARKETPRQKAAKTAQAAEDPPYLQVLLEIRDELEQTDALTRTAGRGGIGKRAGEVLAATSRYFQHRRAAVIVGVSVISLPLLAMAMVGVARSNTLSQRSDEIPIAPVAPLTDSLALMNATLQGGIPKPTLEAPKDSSPVTTVASKTNPPRARPTEEATPRRTVDTADLAPNWIPTLPRPAVARLDSVVGAIATRPTADAPSIQFSSGSDNSVRPNPTESENSNATQRARLIGSLPTPKYPAHLLLSRVGGEVLVRFQVDTSGRPVMSTFSVVSSPDAGLTTAVRRVIPSMRFEPARSPAPDFKAITDVMEIGFRFSPDARE